MNKRIVKKKIKQKYNYMLNFLHNYTEVSKSKIIEEYYESMINLAKKNDQGWIELFLDCNSIELMIKHKCGWYYRDLISKEEDELNDN